MTREHDILKGFALYGTVLPLALILGYLMATPLSYRTLTTVGIIVLVLSLPLVLKWHHPLLFFFWNSWAVLPLFPGRPPLWLLLAFLSLSVFCVQYALLRNVRFIKTKTVLLPLLFMGAVTLVTAQLTGGIGLGVLGDQTIGGKRYIYIFAGIAGYLAMTAQPIPASRSRLYIALFLLGAVTNSIGTLLPYVPKVLYPVFYMFPVEDQSIQSLLSQSAVAVNPSIIARFSGLSQALLAVAYYLAAREGLRALLDMRKPAFWVCVAALAFSTIGGFRSMLVQVALVFTALFFLEGLHRTKSLPIVVLCMVLGAVGIVGFANKLPIAMQRTLSFLPLDLDPVAVSDAKGSVEWRLDIWRELLPSVPKYAILGKGLSIRAEELDSATTLVNQGRGHTGEVAMLAGDYHSGPLSVIIPFGVWGAIGWLWFLAAGARALYLNYRNSPIELKTYNTFLFAYFLMRAFSFFVIFGGFYRDLALFAGLIGFSVSLNNGIRKVSPYATEPPPEPAALLRPRLIPSFSRHLRQ